jgi:hypothetical protein
MKRILIAILFLFSGLVFGAEPVGTVLGVVGTVTVNHENKAISAQRKTPLFENDTITSSENARAQLRFSDGTLTTMGANTSMRIQAFTFKQKNKPNNAQFELLTGAFRTLSGELLKSSGAQFHVQTPVGTIGIRGTDFWGGYLEADNIDVLLISGEHAVEVKNASGTVLLQKAGEGTTLKKDQAAPVVKTWPQAKVDKAVATITWPGGDAPT